MIPVKYLTLHQFMSTVAGIMRECATAGSQLSGLTVWCFLALLDVSGLAPAVARPDSCEL
jgi:hypothetical protein